METVAHLIIFAHLWMCPIFLVALVLQYIVLKRRRSSRYSNPFYPWKRWTWTDLPQGWRRQFQLSVAWFVAFGGLAIWAFSRTPPNPPWGAEGMALFMSLHFAVFAGRLVHRKAALESGLPPAVTGSPVEQGAEGDAVDRAPYLGRSLEEMR